jgi:hypothetical protein
MIVRPEQMNSLDKAFRRGFLASLRNHLRQNHATAVNPYADPELDRILDACVAKAEARGLTLQSKIALFVVYMFEISPRFDEQEPIAHLLNDPSSVPDMEIDYLAALVSEEDWMKAKEASTISEWMEASKPESR